MLVVADERTLRIGGERRLASAGEAEEDRRIAIPPGVGRTMHRHHLFRRQQVIEDGEHRFFHLARIARAADEHDLACEVAGDDRLASRPVPLGVGAKRGHVHDRQIGNEGGQFLRRRTDQEIADEQRMPGVFSEDARAYAQLGIGASVEILSEQRLAFGVGEKVGEESVEMLDRHCIVVVPPDGSLGVRIAHHKLVLRTASGMRASVGDEGSMRGDTRFVALQRVLVELRRAEIPMDPREIAEAEAVRTPVDIMRPVLDHLSPP